MAPRIQIRNAGGVTGSIASAGNQVVDYKSQNKFRQPVYDRVNLSTSLTGEYPFFQNQIGASVTLIRYETAGANAKTKRDTNLQNQGSDNSRDYDIFGIAMALIPAARTVLATAVTRGIRRDKDNIKEGGYLNFKVVDTNILDIPLLLIPEINAESGVATTGNDATAWAGPAPAGPMWNFGESYKIPRGTTFTVTCKWDGTITLAQTFDMYIFLFANVYKPR
jgi:hypothetical protein